jgi:hypothetical protein
MPVPSGFECWLLELEAKEHENLSMIFTREKLST